ncbi:MAG: methionyl-tRNA formyltransferase [Granulosicoccus sp.]
MNCERLKVAFAGTPEFAAVALDALLESSHEVVGVLTQPDRPAGRGRKLTPGAVKKRAVAAGVPVQQPLSLKTADALQALQSLRADVLVVAAYGLILPRPALDMPTLGCLNIHASLLPRWRGAAPIHRAILAGDRETGVCIMQMDEGLDTGDVLLERRCAIGPDETVAQLHDRLAQLGAQALLDALPARCRDELEATVQAETGVTYAEKLTKAEARLDFNLPAEQIHRRVRAFNPWPVAESMLCGQRVRFWQSRMVDEQCQDMQATPGTIVQAGSEAIRVRTADRDIEFLQLQWPGKKSQSAKEFAQGQSLAGEVFTPVGS